jgi:hypothetical protein
VQLVRQWNEIDRNLPADWDEARLCLRLAETSQSGRASATLGALGPGVGGDTLRFTIRSHGGAPSPGLLSRLLANLDSERIGGALTLEEVAVAEAVTLEDTGLASAWEAELERLPLDWSDLYAEIEFRSTDHLQLAALNMSPLNPSRFDTTAALRFRAARTFGYGASTTMVKRCLERADEAGLDGHLRIVQVLSDSKPVATQGPVWRVEGRSV